MQSSVLGQYAQTEHLWAQLEATVERVHSEYLHMEAQARQLERKVNDVLVVNDKAAAAAASASNIVAAAAAASAGARAKRAVSTRHLPVGGSSNITNTAKGTSHSRPLDTSSTAFASDQRGLPQQRLLMNRHVASAAAASPTTRAPAPSSGLAITADESRALAPRDASLLSNHHLQKSAGLACNCKKSKCLKLYCDCFSAGTTCGSSCKCQNCQNDDPNGAARALSMRNIVRRNPYAFKPKVAARVGLATRAKTHVKGCNCVKTRCLKKYCECYQGQVPCNSTCSCIDCKNVGGGNNKALASTSGGARRSTLLSNTQSPTCTGVKRRLVSASTKENAQGTSDGDHKKQGSLSNKSRRR